MFRRALTILIAVVAAAAIATGCGEDSNASPTRAEFTEAANTKCRTLTRQSARDLQDYANENVKGELTKAQQEELLETIIVPRGREQIEALEALGTPEGGEAQIGALIAELDRVITRAEEAPLEAAADPEPFAKSEKMAKAYGLRWCGHQ